MIKKYNQFLNEGVLQHLKGPTEEEILSYITTLEPNEMLLAACKAKLLKGVKLAIERGADPTYKNFSALKLTNSRTDKSEIFTYLKDLLNLPKTVEEFVKNVFSKDYEILKLKKYPKNLYYYDGKEIIYVTTDSDNIHITDWIVTIIYDIYYMVNTIEEKEVLWIINKVLNTNFKKYYGTTNTKQILKDIKEE